QEYSNSATARGGGEPAAVSNCVKAFETLETGTASSQSCKTPRKKKVTFGEVLSPEIFDQRLPANTPLRRGGSPGPPLPPAWGDEGVEPLPEFLEGSVAAEAPSPVGNAEVAEMDKPDMITTRSSKRKQGRAEPEAGLGSGASSPEQDKGTENPRRSKVQRQKNPSTAAPK
ncbi:CDCA2 protein, partial [Aegithalos caudatus]|nr:CDCA2 protein [Aegithalos caudatus]